MKQLTIYLTHHTAEDIQGLTDMQVPMPPWGFSEQVMIPMESCDEAAQLLIRYFGPEQIQTLIGGARWWQMRTVAGLPAEWISQYSDYHTLVDLQSGRNASLSASLSKRMKRQTNKRNPRHEHEQASEAPPGEKGRFADTQEERDRLSRVMLYIHGGGYYFGSVNTHRFQILRIARKFGGFAFAVNYRKAPQFPFPCAIQDCLAAYMYLIRPPPNAKHQAVNPKQIVIAGDSAGGGLSLALLQLLRDLDLPLPAGGVLISPWSDLTHSFPSILQNTATDYIPPYSFIHKPSTLWPLQRDSGVFEKKSLFTFGVKRQKRRKEHMSPAEREMNRIVHLRLPDGKDMPITSQIQLYATNAQLFHPLCSPVLSGSLGGLPPLYICAGDSEVLRDEIIYLAHKAAHPDQYPLREDLMDKFPVMREAQRRFHDKPTNVHLQVFDGQCHVFTMLMQTVAAKYGFRAMASFIKFVTGAPTTEAAANVPDYAEAWQYSSAAAAAYGPPSHSYQVRRGAKVATAAAASQKDNMYSGKVPLQRPEYESHMIRERVDVNGKIRPMEPPSMMQALRMPYQEVGAVKASTYNRFQKGHTLWDTRYRRTAAKVKRKRAKYQRRANRILNKAQAEGLLDDMGDLDVSENGTTWTDLATYGPADLRNECPPPSSIVGRRDTPSAITMLKLSLHLRAKRRRALGLTKESARPSAGRTHSQRSSMADDEVELRYGGEHRPTDAPGEPLGKRFGLWKCTYWC